MPKWQCSNTKVDGRPCGRVVETTGTIAPPTQICPVCKKPAKWAEIKVTRPPLVRQGGRLDLDAVSRVPAILRGLREPILRQGVAGEILKFVEDVSSHEDPRWPGLVQDLERVRTRLRLACRMHDNAEYLCSELAKGATAKMVADLDEALKAKWSDVQGGILGDMGDFEIFAKNPAELGRRARDVMQRTAIVWRSLKTDEEREQFIRLVFEHDKGYHRIRMSLDDWQAGLRPRLLAPNEGVHAGGAGGYDRRGGKKQAPTVAQEFGLLREMGEAIRGRWVGRELYKAGVGKIKLVTFDVASKEYTYVFLGDKP